MKLKLEEQNRNQLTFGAGVSQFEGFFGQMTFQTANFLGRGENLTLSLQAGSRAQNYSLAFTEPFLFDRNITGGFNVFKSNIRYIGQFTQESTGGVITFGFPTGDFTRMFLNYSYEHTRVTELNTLYTDPLVLASNPYPARLAAPRAERRAHRQQGHAEHRAQHGRQPDLPDDRPPLHGVDRPGRPRRQHELLQADARGRLVPEAEQPARRSACAASSSTSTRSPARRRCRSSRSCSSAASTASAASTSGPSAPPIRRRASCSAATRACCSTSEEQITIAGPVRLILFYDAGQVQDGPNVIPPPAFVPCGRPDRLVPSSRGRASPVKDFKTSTGAEIRFFMPVLNVPFRLIFAYNPQRSGVLDSTLQPQSAFQFRFAVGSTF